MNNFKKKITIAIFFVSSFFLGIVFFAWTLVPCLKMVSLNFDLKNALEGSPQSLYDDNFVFYPIDHNQVKIRTSLANFFMSNFSLFRENDRAGLTSFVFQKNTEVENSSQMGAYEYILFGKANELLSTLDNKNSDFFLKKAENDYVLGLKAYPGYQKLMFLYSMNLARQGRFDEALNITKSAYSEDDRVPESHYYLGMILFLKDNNLNKNEALSQMEYALDRVNDPMDGATKVVYEKMMSLYYSEGDVGQFKTVVHRLSKLDQKQGYVYQKISDYIEKNNKIPIINLKK